jgi:hypothetical protein
MVGERNLSTCHLAVALAVVVAVVAVGFCLSSFAEGGGPAVVFAVACS